jgi:transcriptional regulator with XRE-family HTH domain
MSKRDLGFEDVAPVVATGRAITKARSGAPTPPSLAEALRQAGVESFAGEPANFAAMEIGERIRMARQEAGLTQAELARRAGCKQGDLSDIERGKGRDGPSYKTLKAIAVALDEELPINPPPAEAWMPMIEVIGKGTHVHSSVTDYEILLPLYGNDEWTVLKKSVRSRLETLWAKSPGSSTYGASKVCQIVNVGPAQHARFRCYDGFAVLSKVRGGGEVKVRKPIYRFHASEHADAVAILSGDSVVEVDTADGETCVFMVAPAGVLMARTTEADCD